MYKRIAVQLCRPAIDAQQGAFDANAISTNWGLTVNFGPSSVQCGKLPDVEMDMQRSGEIAPRKANSYT